ncbi:hypothetical protein BDR07DRAFT_705819 [Suillus spraguei]|nr:hypothetical protein BDR07DRAFT_705819 [Suillus spraguei]
MSAHTTSSGIAQATHTTHQTVIFSSLVAQALLFEDPWKVDVLVCSQSADVSSPMDTELSTANPDSTKKNGQRGDRTQDLRVSSPSVRAWNYRSRTHQRTVLARRSNQLS